MEVNDKVYIFGHRHTHGTAFSRQGIPEEMPYITEEADADGEKGLKPYIQNLRTGAAAGFKYFMFDGTESVIEMELRGKGVVEVLADSPDGEAQAVVSVDAESWKKASAEWRSMTGTHALYFRVKEGIVDFAAFEVK